MYENTVVVVLLSRFILSCSIVVQVVFGLKANRDGKPDLGLTMQADYYGKQAIVKGFTFVDGKVKMI